MARFYSRSLADMLVDALHVPLIPPERPCKIYAMPKDHPAGAWVPYRVKSRFAPQGEERQIFPRWYLTLREQKEPAAPPDIRERMGAQKDLDTE